MQEPQTEYISFNQMLEEIGVPDDVRQQMVQPEDKPRNNVVTEPGQDIFKQRVRVMFEFDCSVNTEPVMSTSNDSDVKAHDLALLTQFLQTDKAIELMVDKIGAELGLNCPESFIATFLSQLDTNCHALFDKAIAELPGDEQMYWRNIAACREPEDLLSLCTEEVISCFRAEFVSSSYEMIYEGNLPSNDAPSIKDMMGLLKDDTEANNGQA